MRAHMTFHLSTHGLILTLVNTSTSESQNHSENLLSCLQRVIPPWSCLSCLNDVPANEQICISATWKAKSHLRPTGKSLMTRPSDLPS